MQKMELMIDEFMIYCESKNLSRKTMASYEQTLRLFSKYLIEEKNIIDVKKVTEKILREYINYLKERGKYTVVSNKHTVLQNKPNNRTDYSKKVSITTVNNYIRNIKVFFNFLKEQTYIKKDIVKNIKALRNERKPKEYVSDEQFSNMLRHIDTTKFHEYRDYVIINLLLDTGMRIGECLNIKNKDLDINHRSIYLPAENTKYNKGRYVYYSQIMQRDLRRWLQYKDRYVNSEYLFCTKKSTPLLVRTFEKKIKDYGNRVGINIHPHQIRNNFAKRFLMAGGNIYTLSKILGHSSVKVTEKAYLDLTDADIRKNYQQFSPLVTMRGGRK
ncbi:tyrosine-type recombinase/integrase [Anaeromicrobium sediminis]|uniref:Integrase n=1 Tax=Anaeromicrobium sediminis TaxID=1478221 RepID=A0A267MNI3_9FIRM|nr:tyrosine-type recombinase/integrase [Anaeromicrobium sediminis]PAB60977.1 integrase [Anaeromicrobium sediminis]